MPEPTILGCYPASRQCHSVTGRTRHTKSASPVANRSTKIYMRKKKSDRIEEAIAARNCGAHVSAAGELGLRTISRTYDDTVIPSKDRKLIETGHQIPTGSDVASYKDP
jgi:hypothetical protein